jgi:hypothetical protein
MTSDNHVADWNRVIAHARVRLVRIREVIGRGLEDIGVS